MVFDKTVTDFSFMCAINRMYVYLLRSNFRCVSMECIYTVMYMYMYMYVRTKKFDACINIYVYYYSGN